MLKNAIRIALGLAALGFAAGPAQAADAEVKTKGGFEIKSGDFSFKLGGRIMVDYVDPSEDLGTASGSEMGRSLFFRRARIELEGKLFKDWEYKAEYDFAENALAAKDLYIAYTGFEGSEILVGQYKQFFSLEELSSSKGITFMERSLTNAFVRSHAIGVGYRTTGDNYSFMTSIHGQEAGVANAPATEDEDFGFAVRGVWAPVKTDDSLFHLGLAYATESTDAAGGIRFRSRPEARVNNAGLRLVDTGTIDSDKHSKIGFEAAWMQGGFSVQSEFMTVSVDSTDPLVDDSSFGGYYVQTSWFPGGEVRPYKMNTGSFSQIKPLNLDGAWELRARLSNIDLNDDDAGIAGGEETNLGLGVTFYPNANLRFMIEYISADVEGGINGDEKPRFIQARAQLHW